MERFDPGLDDEIWGSKEFQVPVMIGTKEGGYVRWIDYEILYKEYKELEARVKGLKK